MRKYTLVTDDAEVTLESDRNPLVQGAYWLIVTAIGLLDGSFAGTDPPLDLVLRDPNDRHVLYRRGPFHGSEAVEEAQEAARVIRSLGVQGYIDRESR